MVGVNGGLVNVDWVHWYAEATLLTLVIITNG